MFDSISVVEGLDHGERVLAERWAVGGDRAALAKKPAWRAPGGRPAGTFRDHPCSQSRLPMAGLSPDLWAIDHNLQPLQPLGATRHLAKALSPAGGIGCERYPDDRQYDS